MRIWLLADPVAVLLSQGLDPWIEVDGGVTPANAYKVRSSRAIPALATVVGPMMRPHTVRRLAAVEESLPLCRLLELLFAHDILNVE